MSARVVPILPETSADVSESSARKRPRWKTILIRFPYYTFAFVAIYIAIYFTIPQMSPTYQTLWFDSDLQERRQVYRWYTYSLLHANLEHLIMNCIVWVFYSTMVALDNNKFRVFLIQTLSILGGVFGCGWQIRITKANLTLVGASGGIYGMLSCQIGNLIVNWPELDFFKRLVYTTFLISTTVSDIIFSVLMYSSTISYSAHIGGFIMGMFAGGCLMHNIRKLKWERHFRTACGICVLMFTIAGTVNLVVA